MSTKRIAWVILSVLTILCSTSLVQACSGFATDFFYNVSSCAQVTAINGTSYGIFGAVSRPQAGALDLIYDANSASSGLVNFPCPNVAGNQIGPLGLVGLRFSVTAPAKNRSTASLVIELSNGSGPQARANLQSTATLISFGAQGEVSVTGWHLASNYSFNNLPWLSSPASDGVIYDAAIELLPISSGLYLRVTVNGTIVFTMSEMSLAAQGVTLPANSSLIEPSQAFLYATGEPASALDATWSIFKLNFDCSNLTVSPPTTTPSTNTLSDGICFVEDIPSTNQVCQNGVVTLTAPVTVGSDQSIDLALCGGCRGVTVANSVSISGGAITLASDYATKVTGCLYIEAQSTIYVAIRSLTPKVGLWPVVTTECLQGFGNATFKIAPASAKNFCVTESSTTSVAGEISVLVKISSNCGNNSKRRKIIIGVIFACVLSTVILIGAMRHWIALRKNRRATHTAMN